MKLNINHLTMTENQNIEWKESWRDEYLKWVCGFANADGGRLVIGKNNNGAEKSDITIPEIAQQLNRTERTIERLINKLKADKVIRRIGPAKGGHWEVLK